MTHNQRLGNDVAAVASFLLLLVFLTYRSFDSMVFYLNWAAGAGIAWLCFGALFLIGSPSKTFVRTLGISSAWLVVAIMVSPFATDIANHLKIWLVTSYYTIASLAMVEMLFRSNVNFTVLAFRLMLAWISTNGILAILFLLGWYAPTGTDFSGVFHDRNVFSITTLILTAFMIGASYKTHITTGRQMAQIGLTGLAFLMVFISKSVTGLVGMFVLLSLSSGDLRPIKKMMVVAVGVVAIVLLFAVDNPLTNRLDRFYLAASGQEEALYQNESAYLRLYLATEGIQLAREKWLWGVGLDNARLHVVWPLQDTGSFLHNTYLDIMTSGGLVTFLLYYFPIVSALVWLIIKRKTIETVPSHHQKLARISLLFLVLKVVYDMTWTTYFEFGMVFSVVFSIYSVQYLKRMRAW